MLPIRLIILSDLLSATCRAAYATLDTDQLIYHVRTTLGDKPVSLQGSDGELIPVSE